MWLGNRGRAGGRSRVPSPISRRALPAPSVSSAWTRRKHARRTAFTAALVLLPGPHRHNAGLSVKTPCTHSGAWAQGQVEHFTGVS